jgi:hypothetical protein
LQHALNLKNFKTFTSQVKGAFVGEIVVSKAQSPKGVHLRYSARDPKTRRTFNGEWVVPAGADEAEFYSVAEKEFAVRRPEGPEAT